jgi:RNA polymerase sigma factor (sigma-70 family)
MMRSSVLPGSASSSGASAPPGSELACGGCAGVSEGESALPADDQALPVEQLPCPAKWARALGVPLHDAEDLAQAAILALLEKRGDPPRSARDWLWGTGKRKRSKERRAHAIRVRYAAQVEAHLRAQGAPFPAPDVAIERCEGREAARRLLDQVKESRRGVATRHTLEDEALEEIAAETGLALNTIKSRWERAKADLCLAADRDRAKPEGESVLFVLLGSITALCLWVLRGVRRRSGPLFACAGLAIVLPGNRAPELATADAPPPPIDASNQEPSTGWHASFVPYLHANAESERDTRQGTFSPNAAQPRSGGHRSSARLKRARSLLGRATTALLHHERVLARDALRTYDMDFPDNPFPAQRDNIARTLEAP